MTYTINREIAHRELKGQVLFLRPGDQHLFTMNETGRFIWQLIAKRKTVAQITKALSRRFAVPEELAGKDVRKFVRELEKRKVIQPAKG